MKKRLFVLLITLSLLIGFSIIMTSAESDGIALTVTGNGIETTKEYTLKQLKEKFKQHNIKYSNYNTYPTWEETVVEGPLIKDLLTESGLKDDATYIKIVSGGDGLTQDITIEQLLDTKRYYYPNGSTGSMVGRSEVPAILDIEAANGTFRFGQIAPNEQNKAAFVKYLLDGGRIEVHTDAPAQWSAPTPSVSPGEVEAGTSVILNMKKTEGRGKIYYTTDGSEPDIYSEIGNYSDYQPELYNIPIFINKDTTIKAKVIGYGKNDSEVTTFSYNVTDEPIALSIINKEIRNDFRVTNLWETQLLTRSYTVDGKNVTAKGLYLERLLTESGINDKDKLLNFIDDEGNIVETVFLDEIQNENYFIALEINNIAVADKKDNNIFPIRILRDNSIVETAKNQIKYIKEIRLEDVSVSVPMVHASSPVEGSSFVSGDTLTIEGNAYNLSQLAISVRTDGKIIFAAQPVVSSNRFSTSFVLPKIEKNTTCTVFITGKGIENGLNRTFILTPKNTGGDVRPEPEDTVLTIKGDGVNSTKHYNLKQLKNLPNNRAVYSVINTFPTRFFNACEGVYLSRLLSDAGMKNNATLITIISSDGYKQQFTKNELLDATRYYFPGLESGSEKDKSAIQTILSLSFAERTESFDKLKDGFYLCLGQRSITEQNAPWFVKDVREIVVETKAVETWEKPTVDVLPGKIALGSKIKFEHKDLNNVKIYYTTDGSTPNINSTMYNVSREHFQPELNLPIPITKNTTIKAIVIGAGKKNSEIATFNYTVDGTLPPVDGATDGKNPEIEKEELTDNINVDMHVVADTATGALSEKDLRLLIEKNINEWEKAEKGTDVVLDVSLSMQNNVSNIKLTIPQIAMKEITETPIDKVRIKMDLGVIELKTNTIERIISTNSKDALVISFNEKEGSSKADKDSYEIKFSQGKTEIAEIPGRIKVSLKYNLGKNENADSLLILSKGIDKETKIIKASMYNEKTGMLEFVSDELGSYVIGHNESALIDLDKHWAKEEINFLASRNIVHGRGGNRFHPNDNINRAEFLQLLVSCVDWIEIKKDDAKLGFDDVPIDAWHAPAIGWALTNKVVSGYGDNTFGVQDPITREQMVVMINNFVKEAEIELYAGSKTIEFVDRQNISSWAQDAVTTMQKSGIISGKGNGLFDPKAPASRAEAARVIYGLLFTTINL